MRILHVLDHSIPLHSGYSFRTLAILQEQKKRQWQPCMLTGPKQNSGQQLEGDVDGWHFYRTPFNPHGLGNWPIVGELTLMRVLEKRLRDVAQTQRPDIIHAHSPVLNGLPALRVARRLGLPLVYEVRAFWEDAAVEHGTSRAGGARYRATRALETHVLRRAQAVTTICEGLREDIVARGVAADRVTVIPNAVNPERFSLNPPNGVQLRRSLGLAASTVLGFAGSFYGYEGLEVLMRALPLLRKQGRQVKLLLVGGGPEDARLRALATALSLDDVVVFTGRIAHADMPRYYGLIDLLVYPRVKHRLTELVTPLKPLEAMAQGKLVVASDVGGHRELVEDGKTGFLFESESPQALATRVNDILALGAEQADAVRATARRFVETERNWTASVARYASVYERCAGQGARSVVQRESSS